MDHQQQRDVICMTCTGSHKKAAPTSAGSSGSSSGCTYDFVILNSDKDKLLSEKFFTTLEQRYRLKGYHEKRDYKLGVIKQRHLVKTLQTSKFVVELISKQSSGDRSYQRLRSIAHEVECKKGESAHPEVLPIFVDIPREEQRSFTTTVGRSYIDKDIFWEELSSYMLGISFPLSPTSPNFSSSSNSFQDSHSSDVTNNNTIAEDESAKVKYRRKHKVFRGLFQVNKKKAASSTAAKRVRRSKKKGKRKSKKRLKSLRKLLLCVPSRSKTVHSSDSPPIHGQPMSSTVAPHTTARQDSLEGEYIQASRMEISRA